MYLKSLQQKLIKGSPTDSLMVNRPVLKHM